MCIYNIYIYVILWWWFHCLNCGRNHDCNILYPRWGHLPPLIGNHHVGMMVHHGLNCAKEHPVFQSMAMNGMASSTQKKKGWQFNSNDMADILAASSQNMCENILFSPTEARTVLQSKLARLACHSIPRFMNYISHLTIWRFPKIVVPPIGCSIVNHPAIGVPPFMKPPSIYFGHPHGMIPVIAFTFTQ